MKIAILAVSFLSAFSIDANQVHKDALTEESSVPDTNFNALLRGALSVATLASNNKMTLSVDDEDEDDHETLLEATVTVHVPGLNPSKLSPQQKVFMEDALAFAYDKAHKKSKNNHFSVSSHLIQIGSDDDEDDELAASFHSLGRKRYVPRRGTYLRYMGSYACKFCGADDAIDTPEDEDYSALLGVTSSTSEERSALLARWEYGFCKMLAHSRWHFSDDDGPVSDCNFKIDYV